MQGQQAGLAEKWPSVHSVLAAASRFQMARKQGAMESAKKVAERVKPKGKAKDSDSSSSDELEKPNASSSDEETPLIVPKR